MHSSPICFLLKYLNNLKSFGKRMEFLVPPLFDEFVDVDGTLGFLLVKKLKLHI
jgi:hypothetical protein